MRNTQCSLEPKIQKSVKEFLVRHEIPIRYQGGRTAASRSVSSNCNSWISVCVGENRWLIVHGMRNLSGDEMILSYNDVVLRQSDLHILGGTYYLNDRIIEFYLSYLSASYPSDHVLMVSPSIAFWIMNCPDAESLRDFMAPLQLPTRNLIIFPINNNDDVDRAEGGSHWSLLVFERNANVFVHHDSSNGMNDFYADRLYKAVLGFVSGSSDSGEPRYVRCSSSPQQQNGYDCGLYVLAISKVIHNWYRDRGLKDKDGLWFSAVKECVSPSTVSRLRGEISGLIRGLMASCCGIKTT